MPTSPAHIGNTSFTYYTPNAVPRSATTTTSRTASGSSPSDAASSADGGRRCCGCCCSMWRKLFHRHDFRRPETERLYAVYAYRSRFVDFRFLCALLIVLFLSLAVVDFLYAFRPTVDSVSNVGLAAATSVLLVVVHTRVMTSGRLPVAGLVLVGVALVFAAASLLPVGHRTPWSPAEGVWRLCYATFLVYALMTSLRLYVALFYGLVVCAAHGVLAVVMNGSATHPALLWRQVVANSILMIGVNIVGIYVYIRRDHAHRKLFAVVRECSSTGLRLHDERAKLVPES